MGNEDIGLQSYFSDARRYADLWNGSVFEGRQIIKPEELEEMNPVLAKADREAVLKKTRDIVMKQCHEGQQLVVLTVEHQETTDYGMPIRVMLQEALEYNHQIKRIMRKNAEADRQRLKEGKTAVYCDAGEFLYKIRKEDQIYQVLTLIVYWR